MYKSYFLLVLLLALILSCTPKRDSSSEPPSQDTVVLRDTLRIRDTLSSESPKVYVSADKMNIIYVGVDNPISIETEGLDPEELNPNISGDVGGKIKKTGPHNFMVTVTRPGQCIIFQDEPVSYKKIFVRKEYLTPWLA